MKNSAAAWHGIFADFILKGSNAARSQRERSVGVQREILGVCRDPLVSKMRNAVQGASKIWRRGQIRVFHQYWRHPDNGADGCKRLAVRACEFIFPLIVRDGSHELCGRPR